MFFVACIISKRREEHLTPNSEACGPGWGEAVDPHELASCSKMLDHLPTRPRKHWSHFPKVPAVWNAYLLRLTQVISGPGVCPCAA